MKVLSRLIFALAGMVIVLGVLAAPVTGAMGPALGGVDITDSNIRMVVTGTKEECSAACDAEPACAAATFVLPGTIQGPDGHCWLKSASAPQTDNFNCYSFVKISLQPVFGCVMSSPKAIFGATITNTSLPPRGFAPLAVEFSDMSTGVAGGRTWDFGDGSALSHEPNPVHTYTAGSPGGTYYDVTLTVLGACPGETDTSTSKQLVRVFDNIGFLGITTTPAGASVFIDGVPVPGTTSETPGEPLRLAPGSHTVRLTLDGYKEYSGTVTVENGKTITLALLLEKIPAAPASPPATSAATGSLQVTTLPGGASVSVDGTPRGTSPVTLNGLAAGSHTVTLSKAGYVDYTGTLTLPAGKTTMLNITLVPAQGTATTPGLTQPPEAGSSPAAVPSAGVTQAAAGTLPATAGTGSLAVRSDPAGANVYLDGEKAGTTPLTLTAVPAGTHRLLLTLQGYPDISRMVEIASGPNPEVSVTFTGKRMPGFALPVALGALVFAMLVLQGRRRRR